MDETNINNLDVDHFKNSFPLQANVKNNYKSKFFNKNFIIYTIKKIIKYIILYINFVVMKRVSKKIINASKSNYESKTKKKTEKYLYDIALKKNDNNVVTRQLQETCHKLYEFDKDKTNKIRESIKLPDGYKRKCYGCNLVTNIFHHDYIYSCISCGNKFEKYRNFSSSQKGKVALVIGARTKLGHQIVIKLLKAGATVIGTSRYPDKILEIYKPYEKELTKNLVIYDESLDLDVNDVKSHILKLHDFINKRYGKLDILINSAAQTIRSREKNKIFNENKELDSNKYGELKYANDNLLNSWTMTIEDLDQGEMEEIFRTNVVGPTIMIQTLLPLLKKSNYHPTIINVHAREGLITVKKTKFHIHTNYGKTCLHMLTKCLIEHDLKTNDGKTFRIHGCCPGFISIDEYYENERPWIVPPIDEIDGASRILFPLFNENKSCPETRRHYDMFKY